MIKIILGFIFIGLIAILIIFAGIWITLFFVILGGIIIGASYFLMNKLFGGHNANQQVPNN